MKFIQSPVPYYSLASLLILIRLILDIPALGRSFWTDEVWVANSIASPSLKQLFYPEAWLQTTAPLFLLLVRGATMLAGISEISLRLIPYLMAALAAIGFSILARRLLQTPAAILATALFFFTPQLLVFARQLKQYSAELAATVMILLAAHFYLSSRTNRTFLIVLATTLVGLCLGYGLAFMLPSLLLMTIWPLFSTKSAIEEKRKALLHFSCLALIAAGTLIAEYYYFVLPNSSETLTKYWQHGANESLVKVFARQSFQLFQRSLPFLPSRLPGQEPSQWLILLALASVLMSGLLTMIRHTAKAPLLILAYTTILSLLTADLVGIYPAIDRTSFFTLPLTVFLLADGFHSFWLLTIGRLQIKHDNVVFTSLALLMSLAFGLSYTNPAAGKGELNFEDYQSAIQYLKTKAGPVDILFVHGASVEAYRFYSRQLQWMPYRAYTADSGWPCCARNRDTSNGNSSDQFTADLEVKLPWPMRGRLWTLYTNRLNHYQFQGFDERPVAATYIKSKGCKPVSTPGFLQVGVSAWDCP